MLLNIKEVKEYLHRIQKLDRMIEHELQEVEKWKAMCEYPNAPTYGTERVQTSGSNKLPSVLANYITIKGRIEKEVEKLVEERQEIINTIKGLPLQEYDVIYEKYVNKKDFYEIADIMGISYSWVTSVHGRALKSMQKILQDKEKAGC